MIQESRRAEEFRSLCGRLMNFGLVDPLDLDEALLACAPGFALTGIDLYLSAKVEGDPAAAAGRWFIFVDRRKNKAFIPPNALKVSRKRSVVKSILRGSAAYEVVHTSHGCVEQAACDSGDVDFSGVWSEIAIEGNMDAFLRDVGWTKEARRDSASMNHGVGTLEQIIDHKGDWICVTQVSSGKRYTNVLTIGGRVQTAVNAEGKTVGVQPYWADGGKSIVTPHWDANGVLLQVTTRYYRDTEMVVEMSSPGGVTVKRIWAPPEHHVADGYF